MTIDDIFNQIILWTISGLSLVIAWEFYKSTDGKLRLLIIELFVAKVFVYGGAAILMLITNVTPLARLGIGCCRS